MYYPPRPRRVRSSKVLGEVISGSNLHLASPRVSPNMAWLGQYCLGRTIPFLGHWYRRGTCWKHECGSQSKRGSQNGQKLGYIGKTPSSLDPMTGPTIAPYGICFGSFWKGATNMDYSIVRVFLDMVRRFVFCFISNDRPPLLRWPFNPKSLVLNSLLYDGFRLLLLMFVTM